MALLAKERTSSFFFFEKPLFVQPKTKSTIPQKEEAKTLHKEFFSIHQTIKLIHIEIWCKWNRKKPNRQIYPIK